MFVHNKPRARTSGRSLRLAIAARFLGVPQSSYGVDCNGQLVDDAIELMPVRHNSTCVYVIGAIGLGVVKVGWSGNVRLRIRDVANALPVDSIVIGIRDARSQELESSVHSALSQWHQKGEWFRLTDGAVSVLKDMLAIEIDEATVSLIRNGE